jgi:hypothetical protein
MQNVPDLHGPHDCFFMPRLLPMYQHNYTLVFPFSIIIAHPIAFAATAEKAVKLDDTPFTRDTSEERLLLL